MTERKIPVLPFVNLHGHTTFSIFDGFGYPAAHMEHAYASGMDALAITDHGNMNALSFQVQAAQKMKKEGHIIKPIYGVEAYYVPSIPKWRLDYERHKEEKSVKDEEDSNIILEDDQSLKTGKAKSVLNRRSHLLLLAKNPVGLRNLYKLVSLSYRKENFYRYPRVDQEMLKANCEGIIASSACLGGIFGNIYHATKFDGADAVISAMRKETEFWIKTFGDDWYGELQWNASPDQHTLNDYVIQLSYEFGFKLITTNDFHYPNRELWKDREIYKRLGWLGKSNTEKPIWMSDELPSNIDQTGYELYPRNGDETWEAFLHYSALENNKQYDYNLIERSIRETADIAYNKIEDFYPDTSIKLPSWVVPAGKRPEQILARQCADEMKKRGLNKNLEYIERLKRELYVIKDRGFSKYFLTMKLIVDEAKNMMLVGPGRGSSAGSLVAYLLGITQIDPIKWGLQFERFLLRNSTSMPDIDTDFSDPTRLKDFFKEKWGEYSVIQITNFNTLQIRSLLKDVSKFYGILWKEADDTIDAMMKEAIGQAKEANDIIAGVYAPTFEEFKQYSPTLRSFLSKYPQVDTHIANLQGMIRSLSSHASGTLIADSLNGEMPLISVGGKPQTPWTEGQAQRHLEPFGFIKFDILGLKTLEMFETCIKHILRRKYNIEEPTFAEIRDFYNKNLHPNIIDFDNQKIWENVFQQGKWLGIFQFSNSGAQEFCKQVKPTSIAELSDITSIFRPGPLCISGDSKILIRKYSRHKKEYVVTSIKHLYEKRIKIGNGKRSRWEHYKHTLISLNENTKEFFVNDIVDVCHSGQKPVFKLAVQRSLTGPASKRTTLKLKATLEHKFLTLAGWKALKDIKEGEYICISRGKQERGYRKKRLDTKYLSGKKNFRNLAFYNYQYKCIFCDWTDGSLDVNHIEGNRFTNNDPNNLCFMCPNHHRAYTEGKFGIEELSAQREKYKLPFTVDSIFVRFLGIESAGVEETYDLEVRGPWHNFVADGVIVHNSANVNDKYIAIKNELEHAEYVHPIVEEILGPTKGQLIYQEQIASLAHRLGKDISLDDGNMLRKLLTKKGTGKNEQLDDLYSRFKDGCLEKGISLEKTEELMQHIEFFNKYGFCLSHSCSYSVLSFQCAWLAHYHTPEWAVAFLSREPEDKKEKALSIVKSLGFTIEPLDINTSGADWEIKDDHTLVQPLSSIKGMGPMAVEEVLKHRPFKKIEEVLFNDNIAYMQLNRAKLDVLTRSGAMNSLIDSRFNHLKHFWISCIADRPKTMKKMLETIEATKLEPDFSREEKIIFETELTGMYPLDKVVKQTLIDRMKYTKIPPISEFDASIGVAWCVPKKFEIRKTKGGKSYFVVEVIDSNFVLTQARCWSINPEKDGFHLHHPYLVKPEWSEKWGFSTRGILARNWKLLG